MVRDRESQAETVIQVRLQHSALKELCDAVRGDEAETLDIPLNQ